MPWSIRASASTPRWREMTADTNDTVAAPRKPSRLRAVRDSDIVYSFLRSNVTIAAAAVTLLILLAALLAPVLSPQDPYDLRQLSIIDSHIPPVWQKDGDAR